MNDCLTGKSSQIFELKSFKEMIKEKRKGLHEKCIVENVRNAHPYDQAWLSRDITKQTGVLLWKSVLLWDREPLNACPADLPSEYGFK